MLALCYILSAAESLSKRLDFWFHRLNAIEFGDKYHLMMVVLVVKYSFENNKILASLFISRERSSAVPYTSV